MKSNCGLCVVIIAMRIYNVVLRKECEEPVKRERKEEEEEKYIGIASVPAFTSVKGRNSIRERESSQMQPV